MRRMISKRVACIVLATMSFMGLCGCTDTEKNETIVALQDALNSLTQNRSLSEQFVRDLKTTVDPADPAYQQAMDSYEVARDAYNSFLDDVELTKKESRAFRVRQQTRTDVRNATADFLADATSALKPSVNTRRIPFQRAIVIPDDLQASLQRLPKHAREQLVTRFDRQVRWRSWGQL